MRWWGRHSFVSYATTATACHFTGLNNLDVMLKLKLQLLSECIITRNCNLALFSIQ